MAHEPRTRSYALKPRGVQGGPLHDYDAARHYEFDLGEDGDVRKGSPWAAMEVGPSRLRINPSRLRINELGVLED